MRSRCRADVVAVEFVGVAALQEHQQQLPGVPQDNYSWCRGHVRYFFFLSQVPGLVGARLSVWERACAARCVRALTLKSWVAKAHWSPRRLRQRTTKANGMRELLSLFRGGR